MHMHYLLGHALVERQVTLPGTKCAGVLNKEWMMSSCFPLFLVIVFMAVDTLTV